MGNLKAESGIKSVIYENAYKSKIGLSDQQYVDRVNSGAYSEYTFVHDAVGFGLAQWTYESHKQNLLTFARYQGKSVGDLDMQLEFLQSDLNAFSAVLGTLKTAASVQEASDDVLLRYEKPANTGASVKKKRAGYGQEYFDKYADPEWIKAREKPNIVVTSAKARLGDPYVFGALGEECTPANRKRRARSDYPEIINNCPVLSGKASSCSKCDDLGRHIYDCRGFTYRTLKDAGISISTVGATTQWNTKSDWLMQGKTADGMPDLVCCLFKQKGDKMSHTGLHIGDGHIIHCSGEVKTGMLEPSWTHWAIPKGLYDKKTVEAARRIRAVATLKKGSTGAAVKQLQTDLKTLGYDVGTVDGTYGTKTVAAVKAFQQDHGLTVDGIAGMNTQAAIDEAVNGAGKEPSGGKPADGYFMTIDQYTDIKNSAQAILDALKEMRLS